MLSVGTDRPVTSTDVDSLVFPSSQRSKDNQCCIVWPSTSLEPCELAWRLANCPNTIHSCGAGQIDFVLQPASLNPRTALPTNILVVALWGGLNSKSMGRSSTSCLIRQDSKAEGTPTAVQERKSDQRQYPVWQRGWLSQMADGVMGRIIVPQQFVSLFENLWEIVSQQNARTVPGFLHLLGCSRGHLSPPVYRRHWNMHRNLCPGHWF